MDEKEFTHSPHYPQNHCELGLGILSLGMLGSRVPGRPRGASKDRDYSSPKAYYRSIVDPEDLSPRMRMGLRMYTIAGVRTKKEAAALAGCSAVQLTNISNSPAGRAFMKSVDSILEDQSLSTSALIEKLSRRAIGVIARTMEHSGSEVLQLKAAQDLADRGQHTSKIQKHQVDSFTIASSDARAIAESMVAAATVRQRFAAQVENDDFDRVGLDAEDENIPTITTIEDVRKLTTGEDQ